MSDGEKASNDAKRHDPESQTSDRLSHIGPYRILDILGEGGMSVVYLAEQSAPVKRRVALKILKPGMDSKQVVARFESERQALAVLDHPHIAKIFDGGIAESGRPYFVMELVKGDPITDYCDDHRLDNEHRLKIFVDVCSAVQHAHLKGLIHRDLKPSNILVGVVDGKPQPKIIDFGIAKATGTGLTDSTLYTRIGQIIGTPQYMSPEQAGLTGLDIDTRADIYSLGVVLYELLVGTVPLDLRAIGDHAMQIALLEKDPPKPSTRFTELGDTKDEIAKVRGALPDELRRQLQGDLDWIVMRAIEKDRTRRYETANSLAMECKRFLKHEPVLARPPSSGYILQRFVRRNRVTVIAASVTMLAILGGAAAATLGFVRATEAEKEAVREAEVASRVSAFLTQLFQVSDPSEARGNSITAREILDRGAESIESGLDDQPGTQATLMATMGKVYQSLGLLDEAEALLEKSLAIRRREYAAPHEDIAYTLHELGGLNVFQGEFDMAEAYEMEALEMRRANFGNVNENVAHVLTNLAVIEYYRSQYEKSANLFEEALAIFEQTLGAEHPDVINATSNLSSLYSKLGNYEEAERLSGLAIERKKQQFGDDHPDIAVMLGNQAMNLDALGRTEEAKSLYYESLELQRKQLGEHRLVANTMNNIGVYLMRHDDLDGAEAMLNGALEMWTKTLGADNAKVFTAKHNLGQIHLAKNDLSKAETYFQEAIDGLTGIHGADHEKVADSSTFLAEVYMFSDRAEMAEPIIRRSIEVLEQTFPGGHWSIQSTTMRLGACLMIQGHVEEGEAMLIENLKALQDDRSGALAVKRSRDWVSRFYDRIGMPEEAVKYRTPSAER